MPELVRREKLKQFERDFERALELEMAHDDELTQQIYEAARESGLPEAQDREVAAMVLLLERMVRLIPRDIFRRLDRIQARRRSARPVRDPEARMASTWGLKRVNRLRVVGGRRIPPFFERDLAACCLYGLESIGTRKPRLLLPQERTTALAVSSPSVTLENLYNKVYDWGSANNWVPIMLVFTGVAVLAALWWGGIVLALTAIMVWMGIRRKKRQALAPDTKKPFEKWLAMGPRPLQDSPEPFDERWLAVSKPPQDSSERFEDSLS